MRTRKALEDAFALVEPAVQLRREVDSIGAAAELLGGGDDDDFDAVLQQSGLQLLYDVLRTVASTINLDTGEHLDPLHLDELRDRFTVLMEAPADA